MKKFIIGIITLLLVLLILVGFVEAKDKKTIKKPVYSEQQKRALKQKASAGLVVDLWNACNGAESKILMSDGKIRAKTSRGQSQIHCFGIGLSISKAETQMGNAKLRHGYLGRKASNDHSLKAFVKAYNKFYYKIDKYNAGRHFYGDYDKKIQAPTRYCLSEYNTKTKKMVEGYCPNGKINFDTIYQPYKKLFIDKQKDPKNEEYSKDPKRPPKIYPSKSKIKGKN